MQADGLPCGHKHCCDQGFGGVEGVTLYKGRGRKELVHFKVSWVRGSPHQQGPWVTLRLLPFASPVAVRRYEDEQHPGVCHAMERTADIFVSHGTIDSAVPPPSAAAPAAQ